MPLKDIYMTRPELAEYDYRLFSSRLSSIRSAIRNHNKRFQHDNLAYKNFIANHNVSLFSHHGYIEWQGSEAQDQLREDMAANNHLVFGPFNLWATNPVYYTNFPLDVFRDKIAQEERTGKYIFTLQEKRKKKKKIWSSLRSKLWPEANRISCSPVWCHCLPE